MKTLISTLLALASMPLAACQSNDLGTGANTVDRDYAKSAVDVSKAALQSVESADLKVLRNLHDQLGSELVASRGDGKEVHILVKGINDKNSHVSVRVEPGDRELATLMHERIAGNLGMGAATSGWWSGGNSLGATYSADLDACSISARRAIASLDPNSKSEELHATWCHMDGRLKDATPIRIKLEKLEDQKTRATFIAGSAKSDDNRAFVQKMKNSFEATTAPFAGSQ
jgi:hypothetical protein